MYFIPNFVISRVLGSERGHCCLQQGLDTDIKMAPLTRATSRENDEYARRRSH